MIRNVQCLVHSAIGSAILFAFVPHAAFSEEKVSKSDASKRNWTAAWAELPGPVLRRVLWRIAAAPKLQYRVDKMEVYNDGVWVEYSVTNLDSQAMYLTPMFLDTPVEKMSLWDADGREWDIPQFKGFVTFDNPDTFILVYPSGSIRFRSQVSFLVRKPLELANPQQGLEPERPKELTYCILGWESSTAHTIRDNRMQRLTAYVSGFGKVPVKWVDKKSPTSWKSQTRLDDRGVVSTYQP